MSSILKALKKVESNGYPAGGTRSPEINVRGGVSQRARRRLLFKRISLALILVACVGAGGWAFIRYKPVVLKWFSKPETEAQATKKDAATQGGQKTGDTGTAAAREKASRQRTVAVRTEKAPDKPLQRPEASMPRRPVAPEPSVPRKVDPAPPQSPPAPSLPRQTGLPVPPAIQSPPAQSEPRAPGEPKAPPASPGIGQRTTPPLPPVRPGSQPSKDSSVSLPSSRFTRPGMPSTQPTPPMQEGERDLEVQAIAWSQDPGKRIAVVNGKVVREGGTLDGYSVVRIGLEDVTFKRGDVEHKLRCIGSASGGKTR